MALCEPGNLRRVMKLLKCLLIILMVAQPVLGLAETMYVTDLLRLGVHQAPDTSDRPFRTLVSGTPMEILERSTNYALVRLEDGREGWVKSAYLVPDKPARLRLAELESDYGDFQNQLDSAREAQRAAEEKAAQLEATMANAENSSVATEQTLRTLQDENATYAKKLSSFRGSMPLTWVGLAVLVALVGGFMAGLWWLDYLSRRRHGGFRIY
jgi:SH3 domain protein